MQSYPYIDTADLEPHGAAAHVRSACYVNKNEITLQGDFLTAITYERKPGQVHPLFTLKSGNTLLYEWRGGGSWRGFGLPILGQIVSLTAVPTPANIMVAMRNVPDVDRKLLIAGCRYCIAPNVYWTVHGGNHLATDQQAMCQGNFQNVYATRATDQTVRDLTPGETSALRGGQAVPAGARTDGARTCIVTTVGNEIVIDEALRVARDHNRLPIWRPHVVRTSVVSSGADSFQYHLEAVAALRAKYSSEAAAARAAAETAHREQVESMRTRRLQRAIGAEAAELFDEACAAAPPPPPHLVPPPPRSGRGPPPPQPKPESTPTRLPARRLIILPSPGAEPTPTQVIPAGVPRRGTRNIGVVRQ